MEKRLRKAMKTTGTNARNRGQQIGLAMAILLCATLSAAAQSGPHSMRKDFRLGSPVVAATYDLERASTGPTGGFWLQGGTGEVAAPFYRLPGLGSFSVVGSFSGQHASNIQPGVNLGKLTYLAGPRFSIDSSRFTGLLASQRSSQLFGEVLLGGTHAFDSIFPTGTGASTTANSFALQMGGGLDVALTGGFSLRALEVDYVRTTLPNNAANRQNDLRLAIGISYHFGKK
jgi:hypothetical protein